MHKILFSIILFLFASISFSEESFIKVIYPSKNQNIKASEKTFILGNVSQKDAVLTINDNIVPIYKTGGFLAYLPIKPGNFNFVFKLTLKNGRIIQDIWPVNVPIPKVLSTTKTQIIEKSNYLPNTNIGVLPGETILFQCKTLPEKHVLCKVGASDQIEMEEFTKNGVMGFYKSHHSFNNTFKDSSFTFEIEGEPKIAPFTPPVKITVLPPNDYPVLEVINEGAKARFAPNKGYDTFLSKGTKLKATGFSSGYYRANLSKENQIFVETNDVKKLPKSTEIPLATLDSISCYEDEKNIYIKLNNLIKVNGTWTEYESEKKLSIKLHQTVSNIDRIDFSSCKSIKNIQWSQIKEDLLKIDFYLIFDPLWGYDISFKNNGAIVKIRKSLKDRIYNNIKICIDPGHGNADYGAIGPTGITEKEVNYTLAEILGKSLSEKGFKVIYTRDKEKGLSLYERAPFALSEEADIFISIHHNAPSDGTDPYKVRSTESYFYNRAGKKLGEFIHPKVVKATGLKDAGLKYGNLAVCRNNGVPSILIEVDYIIIPEAEEKIKDSEFQKQVAESIYTGIIDFVKF